MAVALIETGSGKSVSHEELRQLETEHGKRIGGKDGRKKLFLMAAANRIASVAALRGLMQAGHAVLLCETKMPQAILGDYATSYRPDGILLPPGHQLQPPSGYARSAAIDGLDFFEPLSADPAPLHHDLALLLATSGSTGSKKFVRLSSRNIAANTADIVASLGITERHRAAAHLPPSYSYGLSVITTHLAAGGSLVLCEQGFTSSAFWKAIRDHKVTSLPGVPYHFATLKKLGLEALDLPDLDLLTQAGGRMEPELATHFADLMARHGGRLAVMYGQTEAAPRIACMTGDEIRRRPGAVGKPMASGRIDILNGEIVYEGPNVMMGYAETRADLARGDETDGRLFTGDLGYLDEDGFLYITGRKKRMAKIDGLSISLDEVETIAAAVAPTAAFEKDGQLVLLTTGESSIVYDHASLHVRIHPSRIRCEAIPSLPRMANGKIDLQALAKWLP